MQVKFLKPWPKAKLLDAHKIGPNNKTFEVLLFPRELKS
jgi:hypothetical protein